MHYFGGVALGEGGLPGFAAGAELVGAGEVPAFPLAGAAVLAGEPGCTVT